MGASIAPPSTLIYPMSSGHIQRRVSHPREEDQISSSCNPWNYRAPIEILIVDDEPHMLNSLRILLEGYGFRVTTAATGSEALDRLDNCHFNLVLLDLGLPDCSGLDIIDTILASDFAPKIIVISGQAEINMAISTIKRGAHDYLRKPYAVSDLVKSVNNALRQFFLELDNQRISQNLQSTERLYRHLVDNSPDLVFTVNPEGNFKFVNRRAETLLGFAQEVLTGQHYSMIVDQQDIAAARYVFSERRVGARASCDVELRLRKKAAPEYKSKYRDGDDTLVVSCSSFGMYSDPNAVDTIEYLGAYGVARDITKRKHSEEIISYRAYHDVLTGLPNRVLLHDRVDVAVKQAQRTGAFVAVMFIDLDGFKRINDLFGHAKGDAVLQDVARRLQDCLRKADTLARIGGDEFAVVLPDLLTIRHAEIIANKLLKSLRQAIYVDDVKNFVTASIGIAGYPVDGESCEQLLKNADIAMYQVKALGKNSSVFFGDMAQGNQTEASDKMCAIRDASNACRI